jgi:transglutaminase-like putative cysteine protease
MPRFSVTHRTRYIHSNPVGSAWQSLHLQPRNEAAQQCETFELQVAPHPPDLASRFDYFGNKQHLFTLQELHKELTITSRCIVIRDEPALTMAGLTPPFEDIPELVDQAVLEEDFSLEQYMNATSQVPLLPDAMELSNELGAGLDPGISSLDWLAIFGERFNRAFVFDPDATQISTPLSEVIAQRRGVCQDFAHLFISCLRQRGLPAAYVSGYLLTRPPAGKPRLVGADASHAWVSFYIPGSGWVDYDPTNSCFVGSGHIVIARGRDFDDVSPVKGLFSGGGAKVLETGVTVEMTEQ